MKYKAGDKVIIKDLETLPPVVRGRVMQIKRVYSNHYDMTELLCPVFWTDELIEGLAEGEQWSTEFECPDGYAFKDENGNVINATKIVLEKKKKEYPKTYEECAEIIAEFTGSDCNPKGCMGYMSVQLTALQKLLICRDVYWKLYGEEMGLSKPWEPDWTNGEKKYCIYNEMGDIQRGSWCFCNAILTFPTAEMRDAYKRNFGPDIEICKELL